MRAFFMPAILSNAYTLIPILFVEKIYLLYFQYIILIFPVDNSVDSFEKNKKACRKTDVYWR